MADRNQLMINPVQKQGFFRIAILNPLARLFLWLANLLKRKHPANFDVEFGSWMDLDVNLNEGGAPKPLQLDSCESGILVYCTEFIQGPKNFASQIQAVQNALAECLDYFNNHFECTNEKCIKPVGKLVWFGYSFGSVLGLQNNTGAVLVQFSCEVET